jgi:hypothetical protein
VQENRLHGSEGGEGASPSRPLSGLVTGKQYGMTQEFFGPRPTKNKPDLPEQIGLF